MQTERDTVAVERQQAYYERTAESYDADHVHAGDEHAIALNYIAQLSRVVGAHRILDVGAGTGRGLRYLTSLRPDMEVVGVEPVAGLRAQAELQGTKLLDGAGQHLPFEEDSFDLVISTGVLHHVPDPAPVVKEMMRVARLGVLISDANRFGQGPPAMRAAKILMHLTHTWKPYMYLRTKGRGYMESEGDGVFYSYSIFDSMPLISTWADRTFVIPTSGRSAGRLGPLLDAPSGLLVALREPEGTLEL
ncbi:hypothetical protein Kisp01_27440 [Kineosporia sp. NBRC 101677]|uniref:class I SAM-dependent methyltransferase n=1 Tax=Kineosporia sp. NBRC 101677 TaxID=3032197 RepID=UPI0024A1E22C|nr:class I SAM-dependent methyltransferase [Kineosporia sp. NBRC 101677]GLY15729.1 hypothetical protein Kisp01_27440 [Kineosporia sp. NBRC 101677]